MADNNILSKLDGLKEKFQSISAQIADPEVIADMKRYVQLNKEYKELEPIIAAGEKYRKMLLDCEGAKDILQNEKDEDLREMAKEEIAMIEEQLPEMEEQIKILLIPADPQDSKNAIMEIRGGTEGMKRQFSPETYLECMPNIASARTGNLRSPVNRKALQAASRS